MSDLGQPLHTGIEVEQSATQSVHHNFERADRDEPYTDVMSGLGRFFDCNVPAGHATGLALYSNTYASQVYYNALLNSGNPLSGINNVVENCVERTEKYVMGVIEYIYDYDNKSNW